MFTAVAPFVLIVTYRKQMPEPKDPKDLRRDEAVDIIRRIQAILWLDLDEVGDYWNPDKDWSPGSDFLDMVAEQLIRAGLRPDSPRENG